MSSKNKINISFLVLIVFYAVGLLSIGWELRPEILYLTPLNLILSIGILLWNHPGSFRSLFKFIITGFGLGYGIEVIGVNTGFPFGEYSYGSVLGFKIWDTPLMIGINWLMLSYCASVCIEFLLPKLSNLAKAILAASTMLLLDYIMEPVAIHYGFWTWANENIPLANYISWFFIAIFICYLFYLLCGKVKNKVAILLFILQFIFFGVLNLKL